MVSERGNEFIEQPSRFLGEPEEDADDPLAGWPPSSFKLRKERLSWCSKCDAPTYHDIKGCVTCREWEECK